MRIGIFGGSFDPVHKGHVKIALKAYKKLSLDTIYFVPARQNPLKHKKPVSPFHRMAMLALALKKYSFFKISDFELLSDEKNYSVYTLEHFKKSFPEANLFFIVGADNIKDFDKWYNFNKVLELANLVIFGRRHSNIPASCKHIYIEANLPYSSTEIRCEISKRKRDLSRFLHTDVENYIKKHRLYI